RRVRVRAVALAPVAAAAAQPALRGGDGPLGVALEQRVDEWSEVGLDVLDRERPLGDHEQGSGLGLDEQRVVDLEGPAVGGHAEDGPAELLAAREQLLLVLGGALVPEPLQPLTLLG